MLYIYLLVEGLPLILFLQAKTEHSHQNNRSLILCVPDLMQYPRGMISLKPCVRKLYVFVKSTYLVLNCLVTKIQRINFEGHKGMEREAVLSQFFYVRTWFRS